MIIIKHRVNQSKHLSNINKYFGVEVDLRSNKKDIYLHHDPFKKGEIFSKWIKNFNHKILVLNVKEEGLENRVLKILKKNKIKSFFFHDQTFSSLIKNMKKTKVSIRYSEYEDLKKTNFLFKNIKWLWIDNFNEIKIRKNFYLNLKKFGVKICIVSPELIKKNRISEIKKIISYFKKNNFKIDAVCTKRTDLWNKFKS
ncbi:hypothetical protein OAS21_01155 [Pelagibacteraceae bacterium]|nr:hypothetical protein [Pelagibacteraceae bacterium]